MNDRPFIVGVLTYNAVSSLRVDLLDRTVTSIFEAFENPEVIVFDNGSTDGSWEHIKGDLFGKWTSLRTVLHGSERAEMCCMRVGKVDPRSPGAGRNRLMRRVSDAYSASAKYVVLSDDDIAWQPGAGRQLQDFWHGAPTECALVSGLLEPDYEWATPRGLIGASTKALWRDSAPAAAWCFKLEAWRHIGPLKETVEGYGEDYDACLRLRENGFIVAQMDLAEHLGVHASTLGNKAFGGAEPLDREKWGI